MAVYSTFRVKFPMDNANILSDRAKFLILALLQLGPCRSHFGRYLIMDKQRIRMLPVLAQTR